MLEKLKNMLSTSQKFTGNVFGKEVIDTTEFSVIGFAQTNKTHARFLLKRNGISKWSNPIKIVHEQQTRQRFGAMGCYGGGLVNPNKCSA